MDEDDPLRLKHGRDASPELVRALEALRKGSDETARLERVATLLGPLLDAAPQGMSSGAAGAGAASYKLTALKLIIGGLALLAPLLWIMRGEDSAKRQAGGLPSPSATVAKQPDAAASTSVTASPSGAKSALPPGEVTAQVRESAHADRGRGPSVKAPMRARRQSENARPVATTSPGEAQADVTGASELEPGPSERNAEASGPSPSPSPSPTQPEAAKADATKPAATSPRSPSEAELLFDARKAMPGDPTRALRRLAEHEKRYPNGQFVPEREVLAIEALRSLGRTAEASARLSRFKARYPDSFHLQRLQH